jgi:hypothetical protein
MKCLIRQKSQDSQRFCGLRRWFSSVPLPSDWALALPPGCSQEKFAPVKKITHLPVLTFKILKTLRTQRLQIMPIQRRMNLRMTTQRATLTTQLLKSLLTTPMALPNSLQSPTNTASGMVKM